MILPKILYILNSWLPIKVPGDHTYYPLDIRIEAELRYYRAAYLQIAME